MKQQEDAVRKSIEKQRELEEVEREFRQLKRQQEDLLVRIGSAWRGNLSENKLGAIALDLNQEQRMTQKHLYNLDDQLQAEHKQAKADVERVKEAKADATH
ncbi:hypothetical protein HCA63_04385 [Listeria booriae]|uniref:Uncharacterized protein n=1 Tax=Listeria booriae TaxID=1552123 RepID=A0A7X1D543_9LIST|nr:hypothetical protein [Listeria booriae]MBC1227191.1 hypothetical protein [Listeria booriae]MBC1887589.1 hypothetical protein [Listeria booriae]MBC2037187.1 hypothetical protein [Listeria booriae]MBC2166356.1 hypothetical protein [Listeria booriae]MBC2196376.1 hypothetical protein [Listeria booriae]